MLDVVTRQQRQWPLCRKPVRQQALGNGANVGEHVGVTDLAPATTAVTGGNKGLLRTHAGPVHQPVEQPIGQRRQRFQGTHVQNAVLLANLDGRMADGNLTVARRTGFTLLR